MATGWGCHHYNRCLLSERRVAHCAAGVAGSSAAAVCGWCLASLASHKLRTALLKSPLRPMCEAGSQSSDRTHAVQDPTNATKCHNRSMNVMKGN